MDYADTGDRRSLKTLWGEKDEAILLRYLTLFEYAALGHPVYERLLHVLDIYYEERRCEETESAVRLFFLKYYPITFVNSDEENEDWESTRSMRRRRKRKRTKASLKRTRKMGNCSMRAMISRSMSLLIKGVDVNE